MTIADDASVRPPMRDDDCGCGGSEPVRRTAAPVSAHADGPGAPGGGRSRHSAPRPLERNAFFPRKLMEVRHWRAEQDYHRAARELLRAWRPDAACSAVSTCSRPTREPS